VYVEHPAFSIDCADGVYEILKNAGFSVKLVGPNSYPPVELSKEILSATDCLVVGGGLGDSDQYDDSFLLDKSNIIREYISNGGRYLGICMGAYIAGHYYLNILKSNTKATQYIKRKDSTLKKEQHDIVTVNWLGEEKNIYFDDGTAFVPRRGYKRISGRIIAKYKNGDAAAIIQNYNKGMVGVIGPHPEAHKFWFYWQTRIRNRWKDCIHHDLLLDFIKKLLYFKQ
jgi:glutamine amidotransferase-like uncharacterized protein